MAKKSGKKAKKESSSAGAAKEALATLIKKKEAAVSDGALQVLIAIASVTTLVTVDTSTEPAAHRKPENIGELL